jgi:P27 family predicted phage terminase small subunit
MGSRGPIRDPNSVRGINNADGIEQPRPRPVIPKCPRYFSGIARREWRRIVPELDRLGLLTCVDGAALEAYCNAYANMVVCQTVINTLGLTFTTETGYVAQRPEVGIVNKSLAAIKSLCAEFGLTPSARARMSLPGTTEDADEMDSLLRSG